MAMTLHACCRIHRLARFVLITADASRLAVFYERAFGCRRLAFEHRCGAEFAKLMDVRGGAASLTLGLGNEVIELLEFAHPGRPYPLGPSSSDLIFQHFAILVTNMEQAHQRLCVVGGWTAISVDGPQRLPPGAGAVTAFKFRDPEGHPLELLAFPDNEAPPHGRAGDPLCFGIDHSAISVADTSGSVEFYARMGLTVSARSLNSGPEQERLDGVREPHVEVTALAPFRATPHIELLCYRGVQHSRPDVLRSNDIAATRLVLETDAQAPQETAAVVPCGLVDPDGHHLSIVAPHEHGR